VTTFVVRGQRAATSWPGAVGSVPDLPRLFDEAICMYVLSQYYLSQEDVSLSGYYTQIYENMISRQAGSEAVKRLSSRPAVMGANNRRYWNGAFLNRVRSWLE
jgi:hypothetical protein